MAHHHYGVPTEVIGKHTIADGRFQMLLVAICVTLPLARQFWDNGKTLENYIRWRTQPCKLPYAFWTFLSADLGIWSLLPVHSVRPKAAQLERGP